ncbi:MAG: ergothioneine biosynthesis protein EgtB [Alphaproteobacteria bacterium]|nr:ergothioneine biosynthesis protein EgtB [Alphaproteobacteria bacterium]
MAGFPKIQQVSTKYLEQTIRDSDARTIALIAGLDDEQLMGPRLGIVNPMLWEIGHIAWFHEKFILRDRDQRPPVLENTDVLYDSMAVAHATRWDLDLPDLEATINYRETIRDLIIERLGSDELATVENSYFTQLTAFHEDMHDEAFTYTRQTHGYPPPLFVEEVPVAVDDAGPYPGDVDIPGGIHMLGSSPKAPYFMDNEKWGQGYEVKPFSISKAPVTNAEFLAFVDAGGYQREELWTKAGWQWRNHTAAERPVYWQKLDGNWQVKYFDQFEALRPDAPVVHINWFEAQAWCKWAARRLPWEGEWEVAASRAPQPDSEILKGPETRYPWGNESAARRHANLDGYYGRPVDVGAFPEGDSAYGCRQMIGNVWEWTESVFAPFEGFVADPYTDYSQPWFDGRHAVLRGGSWATRNRIVWNTFRNFYTCDRRDVVAGFRTCALEI